MKSNYLLLSILCVWNAAFALGGVVTDPISYGYYVEQIKQVTETIKQGKEQIETLGGLRTQVDALTAQFRGDYARTMGIVGAVGELVEETKTIPNSIEIGRENFRRMVSDYEEYGAVDENLRTAFNDPRSATYNPDVYLTYQYNMRQLASRNAIKHSYLILQDQEKRLKKLEELGNQIDKTENVKDATDLNNRMLAEIIKGNTEMLAILTRIAEMMALDNYAGIEPEVAENEITENEDRVAGRDNRQFKMKEYLESVNN